jgi:thiol-disulfide isomerase/thioredoxin
MKNLTVLFSISILVIVSSACHHEKRCNPDRIIIAGKIENYKPAIHDNTLKIVYYDLIEEDPQTSNLEINDSGKFSFSCNRKFPQEFYLIYGRLFPLHLSPGDSLYMKLDAAVLSINDTVIGKEYDLVKVDPLNTEFFEYDKKYEKIIYKWNNKVEESTKAIGVPEYIKLVDRQVDTFKVLLQEFEKEKNPSREFREWKEHSVKYMRVNELMRYRWLQAMVRKLPECDFIKFMPADYFNFLNSEKIDISNLRLSTDLCWFVHEYYNYCSDFASAGLKPKDTTYFIKTQEQIVQHSHGSMRQAILARFYSYVLDCRELYKYCELRKAELLKEPFFITYLEEKYHRIDSMIKHPVLPKDAFLKEMDSKVVKAFVDSLINRNKGKVMYIDFWATWCSPCMQEMPYSLNLQKLYKDKGVAFVFLATRSKENLWKATISEKKLTGQHYLLTTDQSNVLSQLFNISGIPHYGLIDKKGNIVNKDAPMPSEEKKIQGELNKLLAE